MWHPGLMMKLHNKKIQPYLWHLFQSWYSSMSSSVLWYSNISRKFSLKQGIRQGAILSPLLYSVFVDELLDQLCNSGLGVSLNGVFCGSPMYADDLALIAESQTDLQAMLNLVGSYASTNAFFFLSLSDATAS